MAGAAQGSEVGDGEGVCGVVDQEGRAVRGVTAAQSIASKLAPTVGGWYGEHCVHSAEPCGSELARDGVRENTKKTAVWNKTHQPCRMLYHPLWDISEIPRNGYSALRRCLQLLQNPPACALRGPSLT
ncbi:hypothetical protein D3C87_1024300 [compost metagenome]